MKILALVFAIATAAQPAAESFRSKLLVSGKGHVAEAVAIGNVVGTWYEGDGLGVNLHLVLSEDGTYTLEWRGCLGIYGTATGQWSLKDSQILFEPTSETGMLKDQRLLNATVVQLEGRHVLVDSRDEQRFIESKAPATWSFQRPEDLRSEWETK